MNQGRSFGSLLRGPVISALRCEQLEQRLLLASDCAPLPPLSQPASDESPVAISSHRAIPAAYDLGAQPRLAVADKIHQLDREDWFRFEVTEKSQFRVDLHKLNDDLDLFLYQQTNGSLKQIGSSRRTGTSDDGLTGTLPSGTYYVGILPWSAAVSRYQLNVKITTAVPADPPKSYAPPRSQTPPENLPQPAEDNRSEPSEEPVEEPNSNTFDAATGYGLINVGLAVEQLATQISEVEQSGSNETDTGATTNSSSALHWPSSLISVPQSLDGTGTVVAVIDTGVALTHSDLSSNLWTNAGEIAGDGIDNDGNGFVDDLYGWDFVDNDASPDDAHGHGTHVAGIIAAQDDGVGITGVASGTSLMPIRVLDERGLGSSQMVASGIRYAVDAGADVINLSLGGAASHAIAAAIEYAFDNDVFVVMAAGNNGGPSPQAPANLATTRGLAVGAVDRTGNLTSFTNRAGSSAVQYVVAPGQQIYSTYLDNRYATMSGTSMAAPFVAGSVALLRQAFPTATVAQIEHALLQTATSSQAGQTNHVGASGNHTTAAASFNTIAPSSPLSLSPPWQQTSTPNVTASSVNQRESVDTHRQSFADSLRFPWAVAATTEDRIAATDAAFATVAADDSESHEPVSQYMAAGVDELWDGLTNDWLMENQIPASW